MRVLPCHHCKGDAYGRFGAREERLIVGRISRFPYAYKCSRCKQLNVLHADEWNKLTDDKELALTQSGV